MKGEVAAEELDINLVVGEAVRPEERSVVPPERETALADGGRVQCLGVRGQGVGEENWLDIRISLYVY